MLQFYILSPPPKKTLLLYILRISITTHEIGTLDCVRMRRSHLTNTCAYHAVITLRKLVRMEFGWPPMA
jgi:hypothetical protein